MNLIEQIKSLLSSDQCSNELSSLIGSGLGGTRSAIEAAVPALLAGLKNTASSSGGVQRLLAALGKFDSGSLNSIAGMLGSNPRAVQEQGTGLLNSLLGNNMVSGIASAVARFAGIGTESVQKLLGYLMPLVLGGIAGRPTGAGLTAQGLTSLFEEQKSNLANALPSGFSLANVPGLDKIGGAAEAATQEGGASALKWLVPAALALAAVVVGYLLWPASRSTPPRDTAVKAPDLTIPGVKVPDVKVPDVAQLTTDVTSAFTSMTDSLGGITDAASAEKALPKLTEQTAKLTGMKALIDQLPTEGKTKVADLLRSSFGKLEDQFAKLMWIPGVAEKIKPLIGSSLDRIASLAGLPAPQLPRLSGDLAATVASMTEVLKDVKNSTTAEAALPKLKEIDGKLDDVKADVDKLSDSGKASISALVKRAMAGLKDVVDKVLAASGASDKIKPVVDAIMGKLHALAA